jgi:hypothetical protein
MAQEWGVYGAVIGVPCAIMNRRVIFVLILFVGLLLTGKAQVQEVEHAPTVEQCRADQRLWLSKLEDPSGTLPRYLTLGSWSREMAECRSVDPDNQMSVARSLPSRSSV